MAARKKQTKKTTTRGRIAKKKVATRGRKKAA